MQEINISPLQVERYYLKELNFQVMQSVELSQESIKKLEVPEISISSDTKEMSSENRKWKCEITIQSKENKNSPYNFKISLIGFFVIDKNYDANMVEQLAKFNCPSILYSTAREMLTTTIRRSPFPPVMLPSVMFSPVNTDADEKETKLKKVKGKSTKKLPPKATE
jgi:preprotein translocase subunit SecB